MQRRILAAAAVLFLLAAVAVQWRHPQAEGTLSFCWRAGTIMAAAWLAYDDVQRLPNWLLLLLPIVLIVLVRWVWLTLLLIPALILYAVLRRFLGRPT